MRKTGKKYRGGGLGQTYTLGSPLVPGVDTGISFAPQSSCMAADRPGMVAAPTMGLGLPGMGGGRRKRSKGSRKASRKASRKGSRKGSRKMRGGRYSFDLQSSATFGGTPWGSGIPQVMSIPCESARANPLNQVQMGGVGGVDSAFYAAPTAGYTNTPSTWVGSTGSPVQLQTPYEARTMNPACLLTGGKRSRGRKRTQRR